MNYKPCPFCGTSESIYRVVDIYTKYAKNHTAPLKKEYHCLIDYLKIGLSMIVKKPNNCFNLTLRAD